MVGGGAVARAHLSGKGGRAGFRLTLLSFACGVASAVLVLEAAAQASDGHSASAPAPVTSAELVEMRGLAGVSVSPDGARVAVRVDQQSLAAGGTILKWRILSTKDATSVEADAGEPLWAGNGSLEGETPQWSADGRWLYYRALADQQVQVWRLRQDGARREQVTHGAADVEAFSIEPDGTVLIATLGATRDEITAAEQAEYDKGSLYDARIVAGHPIARGVPINGRMRTYRGLPGSTRLRGTLLADRPSIFAASDLTGRQALVPPSDSVDRYIQRSSSGTGRYHVFMPGRFRSSAGEQPDGPSERRSKENGRIAVLQRADSGIGGDLPPSRSGLVLQWRALDAGRALSCTDQVCLDADNLALVGWRRGGRELVFQTVTFGTEAIHVWDVERNIVRHVASGEGVYGALSSGRTGVCDLAETDVICISASADQPPRLVATSLDTGRERILLDPNPSLTPDRLGRAEKFQVKDRFGGVTYGRLILPYRSGSIAEKRPVVITSYACSGFLLGGSGEDVPEHVLAGLGYASACVDTTIGAMRYPPGFKDLDGNPIDESMFDTFLDTVRVLDARGVIDRNRVMLTGMSASASGTLYALTRSDIFAAAIITTQGYNDISACYARAATGECRRLARSKGYPQPYDIRENNPYFADLSPAWRVDAITRPVLMQLAEVEHRDMLQFYSAMKDYGRGVEMYVFPDEFHIKRQPRHRFAVYETNIDWIAFWLRGEERGAGERVRNGRWQAMRDEQCKLFTGDAARPNPPWYCGVDGSAAKRP